MHKNKIKTVFIGLASIPFLIHAVFYGLLHKDLKRIITLDAIANRKEIAPKDGIRYESECNHVGLSELAILLSSNPYFRTLFFHRIRQYKLSHLLWGRKSGLEIPYDVDIGPGVILDHPFSTIINAKRIGANLRIKNNITIGNKNDDENLRPQLGDNVYIGAGAIVIGDITIGDNVIIGAGAVVTKSLPDNCVAVGNPAKIIRTWSKPTESNL